MSWLWHLKLLGAFSAQQENAVHMTRSRCRQSQPFPLSKENISSTYSNSLTSPQQGLFFLALLLINPGAARVIELQTTNAASTGVLGLVRVKKASKHEGDKVLHPCISTVRPLRCRSTSGIVSQILRDGALGRCPSPPLQKGLQAALATLPKK